MNGIFIVHDLDDSVNVNLQIFYTTMLSSGDYTYRYYTIPDPKKVNHLYNIDTVLREYKTSTDIFGSSLAFLGFGNNFESTFSIDNDVIHWDGDSGLAETSYVAYMFFIE